MFELLKHPFASLPQFGTAVLYAILVAAAYTFAVAVAAGVGRPRMLQAARLGAYGTIALVGLAVLVLAYAFVSHDFRIAYVARYSERAMSTPFLIVALWGGQDGSLLWWLFLTSLFSGICVKWLGRRYLELQPYVIATLMGIVIFFGILMIFAVNPFATKVGGAPLDGEGLNYQLRNFYMIIHPPSLYTGFTSCAVPFAFCVAALITGRLDSEWIVATRKWMLFSWLFLSIGNALGMLWAYEELGWGGYWAWDPVENAACLPWFTATAYVHSTMIQERRGMLKIWNVFLIVMTFWLTIFGTFLTRSGLISSVHSFAQSGIGIYFVWFMGVIAAFSIALIVYRLPRLRSEGRIESVLSRELAFVLNNWGLLSICVFIALATIWPPISEWLLHQKSTLGPTFYNAWVPPIAIVVFALMGIAPLLGWRKTSPELFKKSFIAPVASMIVAVLLHYALSNFLRFPPIVSPDPIYPGSFGKALAWVGGNLPVITVALAGFNLAVVVQEFVRGVKARRRAAELRNAVESIPRAFLELVAKSRRRYGGYIVHVGIVLMFIGFTGRAWGTDKEATLELGETVQVEDYTVLYVGPRMVPDPEKNAIYADLDVYKGKSCKDSVNAAGCSKLGRVSPAKFVYKGMGGSVSTEIARHVTLRDDLYVTLGMRVNPETKTASLQFHVNPLVTYIWIGVGILIFGALISLWPDVQEDDSPVFGYIRLAASIATSVMFAVLFAAAPSHAFAGSERQQGPPAAHDATLGSVEAR
ncbi:MAG: cytochrome c-type biogenesis CcmF C-terminal domain-containing protein [Polyangiaceae bacterium]